MASHRGTRHFSVISAHVKVNRLNNQEDASHFKRTTSTPKEGPKKRAAFVDLTNTNKALEVRINSGKPVNKVQISKVAVKTNSRLKECERRASEEQNKNAEHRVETLSAETGTFPHKEQPACQQALQPAVLQQNPQIPRAFNISTVQIEDCLLCPEYAKEIFDYLRNREEKFILTDYLHSQPDLNANMRGVLVDWMVEVQENYELNHETLYLAVKLTDHYLSVTETLRDSLQLLGSTAMLIAAKFEERYPPCVDDFMYICDDAYQRREFLAMERNILQNLNFDINIPVPYRFLRRYAKVASASMETLTLARYVCELSLLELELVPERASRLASACLLLALITKGMGGWTSALQFHSGYMLSELSSLVRRLYAMLACPVDEKLRAVENKYSHKVFFEVAKMPLVPIETLEEALSENHVSV